MEHKKSIPGKRCFTCLLLKMRTELERCEGEVRKLELKLEQARDLLSTETSQRKKAEQERDMMGQKWDMVR